MALMRHLATLLAISVAVNTNQTGTTYSIIPSDSDKTDDADMGFQVQISASQTGGLTAPTTDLDIQTSVDKVNWVTVASMTQLTSSTSISEIKSISVLGPYVRAVTRVGGGTAPNHTATVTLMSSGSFKLQAAA